MGKPTGLIAVAPPAELPWIAGRYYDVGSFAAATGGTMALLAGNLYGELIYVPKGSAFDQIAVNVTVAGTGNARLGVYLLGGDGLPAALIQDGGEVDISTTGVKAANLARWASPGAFVVAAILPSSAITVTSMAASNSPLGYPNEASTTRANGYQRAPGYGALPATFGTVTTYPTNNIPALRLRAA